MNSNRARIELQEPANAHPGLLPVPGRPAQGSLSLTLDA
jgi:hypothetical protein